MITEKEPLVHYCDISDSVDVLWGDGNYFYVHEYEGQELNGFDLLLSEETKEPIGVSIRNLDYLIEKHKQFMKECDDDDRYKNCVTIEDLIAEGTKHMVPFKPRAWYSERADTNYFEVFWANVPYYCSGSHIFAGSDLYNGLELYRHMDTKEIIGIRIYEAKKKRV